MKARDIMTQPVISVGPDMEVPAIAQLLLDNRISAVPVVVNDQLVGIVSEGDLLRRHEAGTEKRASWWLQMFGPLDKMAQEYVQSHGLRARDVMTSPVISVDEETPTAEIAEILETHRIKRVPVVKDGAIVGIVSRANLLQSVAAGRRRPPSDDADDAVIAQAVRERIRAAPWAKPLIINVTVTDGHVELWGLVHSPVQRQALILLAERTRDVRGVTDRLQMFERAPNSQV
jgi:CBS-domain-containing membrane protein